MHHLLQEVLLKNICKQWQISTNRTLKLTEKAATMAWLTKWPPLYLHGTMYVVCHDISILDAILCSPVEIAKKMYRWTVVYVDSP